VNVNYVRTLIAVADDCPVTRGVVPPDRGAQRTVASVQYAMPADRPYGQTQEDVLFGTWLERQNTPDLSAADIARLREEFFSRPQACLRSSPLPKKYGWGLHFDDEGRVALCPMDSKHYRELVTGHEVHVLKAMRSKRASSTP
jgi:Family of unknown function (DUF6157)